MSIKNTLKLKVYKRFGRAAKDQRQKDQPPGQTIIENTVKPEQGILLSPFLKKIGNPNDAPAQNHPETIYPKLFHIYRLWDPEIRE